MNSGFKRWGCGFGFAFVFLALSGAGILQSAVAGSFRTPAKRYGAAYSIKVSLFRKGMEFVIPMWVKPDQKESTIDPRQMVFMGWNFKDSSADNVVIAGLHFGQKNFKTARSDWAVKPEYPKNCCMGVIGQDFLKQYRLRFDPATPVHIEWTSGPLAGSEAQKPEPDFEDRIQPLFSVRSEVIRLGQRQYDLGSTPFVLDFRSKTLSFEKGPVALRPGRSLPLVRYDYSGRDRDLSVIEVRSRDLRIAQELGLTEGAKITELNGTPVSAMSYYEVESLLKGRKGRALEIGFLKDSKKPEKSKIIFDLEKNEFKGPGTLQSPSRGN
jgi:hypothetical protein